MTDDRGPDGPDVTLTTNEDGQIETLTLGETTLLTEVGENETVDLTQVLYEAGFELTTRDLESFLVEVDPEDDEYADLIPQTEGDSD